MISLPKSQDFILGPHEKPFDIVPAVGDYGFAVINGDLKAKEDCCKPEANQMQQLGSKRC
jgi:hypothetical protein